MKEKIRDILTDLHDDVDYDTEKGLVDNGILDSFDIINLIAEINGEFDVAIPADKILPEYFNSLDGIAGLVESLILK